MSYLKMLGLARGKLPGAAGLFSTAVISGSSSAPNLRVMIPSTSATNAALEGFGGVPAIRPLETLHNALSLRQLDAFLERVAAAPRPPPTAPPKHPSPTNSVGWSGPSSLMSSSGELPSGRSSSGPSSPNSNYNSENKTNSTESKLPQWDGEAATLCLEPALHPYMPHSNLAGSSISGDVTPVSIASELDFNSNEATAGSITDHDLLSAEGEDDEETLSVDPCGSPVKHIKNDLSPHILSLIDTLRPDSNQPSTSKTPTDFFGLNLQQTKETFHKDMPSSSKNYNIDNDALHKFTKGESTQCISNLDSLNLQGNSGKSKSKRNDLLNNGSRRYSDSSAMKNSINSQMNVSASRFTTTPVTDDRLRPTTSGDSRCTDVASGEAALPSITKARHSIVKPGFQIADT